MSIGAGVHFYWDDYPEKIWDKGPGMPFVTFMAGKTNF